ncbi:MAG: hypothetical protein AABX59_00525 [Nanoarchaeota archaeon]
MKKAQIFSIDAAIALFIVAIILTASLFYVIRSKEILPELQVSRVGYDIVAVLDHEGILQTLDQDKIAVELNKTIPVNYEMRLTLVGEFEPLEVGSELQKERFISSGKRIFVINSTDAKFGIAAFWIWTK